MTGFLKITYKFSWSQPKLGGTYSMALIKSFILTVVPFFNVKFFEKSMTSLPFVIAYAHAFLTTA